MRTPDRARVTVTDDDLPAVTVAAQAAAVTEGADAVFTLTRTEGELSQTLEVPVAVTDSGAVLAGAPPTGVTFAAGDATATLRLGTDDDAAAGPDAPVTLTLQAARAMPWAIRPRPRSRCGTTTRRRKSPSPMRRR